MAINLKSIEEFAVRVAEDAGKILIHYANNRSNSNLPNSRFKKNSVDIVTEADEKLESFIHEKIKNTYPDHAFVGEESYSAGEDKRYLVSEGPTWVVDPLDGTVNYLHLFPMTCILIGFCLGGKPVAGAIHAPFLAQTYSASSGNGAWLNERISLPLQKTPLPKNAPEGCIFACEWGKDRRNHPELNLLRKVGSFVNMAAHIGNTTLPGMCHGVRSLGSASLDLCFVATGAFDIWWEGGCWEWDVCAGFIIVEESGGLITNANPCSYESEIPPANLASRLYLAVRSAADSDNERLDEAQARVVRAVWDRVDTLSYERPV